MANKLTDDELAAIKRLANAVLAELPGGYVAVPWTNMAAELTSNIPVLLAHIDALAEERDALREALVWLVHLHNGVSKGGEEHSPPSDAEWEAALRDARRALDKKE